MNAQTFLHLCLVLHLAGLTMMAGMIIASFTMHARLSKQLAGDRLRAINTLDLTMAFPRIIGIGALLLLLTGIGMVSIFKVAVTSALWFRIKMVLVVLVLVNGAVFPGKNTARLKGLLAENRNDTHGRILVLNNRMNIFHAIQLILFLTIFTLSVFRF